MSSKSSIFPSIWEVFEKSEEGETIPKGNELKPTEFNNK